MCSARVHQVARGHGFGFLAGLRIDVTGERFASIAALGNTGFTPNLII
jgi:hypothetical protein